LKLGRFNNTRTNTNGNANTSTVASTSTNTNINTSTSTSTSTSTNTNTSTSTSTSTNTNTNTDTNTDNTDNTNTDTLLTPRSRARRRWGRIKPLVGCGLLRSRVYQHAFRDYLDRCDPMRVVTHVATPTLLVNAMDDPICVGEDIPVDDRADALVKGRPIVMAVTSRGRCASVCVYVVVCVCVYVVGRDVGGGTTCGCWCSSYHPPSVCGVCCVGVRAPTPLTLCVCASGVCLIVCAPLLDGACLPDLT